MALTSWVPRIRTPSKEGTIGLGLLPHLRVIPHFDTFAARVPDIVERFLLPYDPAVTVIGVDEETALVGGPKSGPYRATSRCGGLPRMAENGWRRYDVEDHDDGRGLAADGKTTSRTPQNHVKTAFLGALDGIGRDRVQLSLAFATRSGGRTQKSGEGSAGRCREGSAAARAVPSVREGRPVRLYRPRPGSASSSTVMPIPPGAERPRALSGLEPMVAPRRASAPLMLSKVDPWNLAPRNVALDISASLRMELKT